MTARPSGGGPGRRGEDIHARRALDLPKPGFGARSGSQSPRPSSWLLFPDSARCRRNSGQVETRREGLTPTTAVADTDATARCRGDSGALLPGAHPLGQHRFHSTGLVGRPNIVGITRFTTDASTVTRFEPKQKGLIDVLSVEFGRGSNAPATRARLPIGCDQARGVRWEVLERDRSRARSG